MSGMKQNAIIYVVNWFITHIMGMLLATTKKTPFKNLRTDNQSGVTVENKTE